MLHDIMLRDITIGALGVLSCLLIVSVPTMGLASPHIEYTVVNAQVGPWLCTTDADCNYPNSGLWCVKDPSTGQGTCEYPGAAGWPGEPALVLDHNVYVQ
jgi:hypothetical protein